MSKIKSFLKKISWKTVGIATTIFAIFAGCIAAITMKSLTPFKPVFYNYASYMSQKNTQDFNKKYEYKEFGTLNEFTRALLNDKAIAGIGSDFQAVTLIKEGKLAKINYEDIFGKGVHSPQNYLRPMIWNHLNSYDEDLNKDRNVGQKDPQTGQIIKPIHLWEYFVPYYSQNSIIAYNYLRIANNKQLANKIRQQWIEKTAKDKNITQKEAEEQLQDFFDANKHLMLSDELSNNSNRYDILKALSELGYKDMSMTDAVRDNMMIGSEYINKQNKFKKVNGRVSSNPKSDTYYKTQISSFLNLIKDATGLTINSKEHKLLLKGDGLDVLQYLINPNSDISMGIMYNGDALDAYYSTDNFEDAPEGSIRIAKPLNGILLLDGLVVSSTAQINDKNSPYYGYANPEYVKDFKTYFYDDYSSLTKFYQDGSYNKEASIKAMYDASVEDGEINYEKIRTLSNFDYINYTPTYRVEYDFLSRYYFSSQIEAKINNNFIQEHSNITENEAILNNIPEISLLTDNGKYIKKSQFDFAELYKYFIQKLNIKTVQIKDENDNTDSDSIELKTYWLNPNSKLYEELVTDDANKENNSNFYQYILKTIEIIKQFALNKNIELKLSKPEDDVISLLIQYIILFTKNEIDTDALYIYQIDDPAEAPAGSQRVSVSIKAIDKIIQASANTEYKNQTTS